MRGNKVLSVRSFFLTFGFLLGCFALTSCKFSASIGDCDSVVADDRREKAKVCNSPTVRALAQDLDQLEEHIEKYGSVVAQHPDVWGQARLTKHREDFEKQMARELDQFAFTLQGSTTRSDTAYFYDAFALSTAAAAAAAPRGSGSSTAAASTASGTVDTSGGSGSVSIKKTTANGKGPRGTQRANQAAPEATVPAGVEEEETAGVTGVAGMEAQVVTKAAPAMLPAARPRP